jgi:hypothetical protein
MVETGKLYTLIREVGIVSYNVCDHHNPKLRTRSSFIDIHKFQIPFIILEEHISKRSDEYWVKVVIEDQTGWICVDPDQLRIFKSY